MTKLTKIDKPASLSAIAYNRLRDSILSFHLKPNVVYNEVAIAQELGLSRTPVREALLKLASFGMIKSLPRKGFIVSPYTLQDVDEVFEIRDMIETAVAKKIAATVSEDSIEKLKGHISTQYRTAETRDSYGFMLSDREFHYFFFQQAKNTRLLNITDNFQDLCHLMGANVLKDENNYDATIEDHEEIVAALESRNIRKVEQAVSSHLSRIKAFVIATLQF